MALINSFLSKSVEEGKMTQVDKDVTMSRVEGTTKMDELTHCNLVIEALVENIELKRKIFKELDKIYQPNMILTTNTSCLSISDIAATTSRPDKVLGLHFCPRYLYDTSRAYQNNIYNRGNSKDTQSIG